MRTRHKQSTSKSGSAKGGDCVDANPRLVMAVMAIGMIVGALLIPAAKTDGPSSPAPLHAKR